MIDSNFWLNEIISNLVFALNIGFIFSCIAIATYQYYIRETIKKNPKEEPSEVNDPVSLTAPRSKSINIEISEVKHLFDKALLSSPNEFTTSDAKSEGLYLYIIFWL